MVTAVNPGYTASVLLRPNYLRQLLLVLGR